MIITTNQKYNDYLNNFNTPFTIYFIKPNKDINEKQNKDVKYNIHNDIIKSHDSYISIDINDDFDIKAIPYFIPFLYNIEYRNVPADYYYEIWTLAHEFRQISIYDMNKIITFIEEKHVIPKLLNKGYTLITLDTIQKIQNHCSRNNISYPFCIQKTKKRVIRKSISKNVSIDKPSHIKTKPIPIKTKPSPIILTQPIIKKIKHPVLNITDWSIEKKDEIERIYIIPKLLNKDSHIDTDIDTILQILDKYQLDDLLRLSNIIGIRNKDFKHYIYQKYISNQDILDKLPYSLKKHILYSEPVIPRQKKITKPLLKILVCNAHDISYLDNFDIIMHIGTRYHNKSHIWSMSLSAYKKQNNLSENNIWIIVENKHTIIKKYKIDHKIINCYDVINKFKQYYNINPQNLILNTIFLHAIDLYGHIYIDQKIYNHDLDELIHSNLITLYSDSITDSLDSTTD